MSWKWTPKMIHCADCGSEVLAVHNKTRFCSDCRKRRDRETNARYRERERLKHIAEKPEEPEERDIHYCDSPENVQRCLNCTKPKCTNCLQHETNGPKEGKPCNIPDGMREKIIPLVREGLKQSKIAKQLGVSEASVSRWVSGLRWEGAI